MGLLGYFLLLMLPCVICLHEAEKIQVFPAECKDFIYITSFRTYLFITNKYEASSKDFFFVFCSLVECNGQKGARKIKTSMHLLSFSTRMNIINVSQFPHLVWLGTENKLVFPMYLDLLPAVCSQNSRYQFLFMSPSPCSFLLPFWFLPSLLLTLS